MNMNMLKKTSKPDLKDPQRALEIVKGYRTETEEPLHIIKSVLHDLKLDKNPIYHGKITSCVILPQKGLRIHIRRPEISTHDTLRGIIPYKDECVNLMNNTIGDVVSDSLNIAQINPKHFGLNYQSPITVQRNCKPLKFEHVLRGYIAESTTETSLFYHYFVLGKREFCGHIFPDGLVPNQKLDRIYDTPSTKEERDISVSPEYLFKERIITRGIYEGIILPSSLEAYEKVSQFLKKRKLELVDTKLEFGFDEKTREIYVIDETFTADSSRMWLLNKKGKIELDKNKKPFSFSKQFARDLATGKNKFTPDQVTDIAVQYILSTQLITSSLFNPLRESYYFKVRSDIEKVLASLK